MNNQNQWLFEAAPLLKRPQRIDQSFNQGYSGHPELMEWEQAVILQSDRFRGDQRLQSAANNRPPLRQPERSNAVRKLQQALIDLGYPMPITTKRGTQPPDGIYGNETTTTVRQFQSKYGLKVDGVAGSATLSRLDQIFTKTKPTRPPQIIPVTAGACGNLFIWINAFIPQNVPGYTFTVPTGPHARKTAIPCPGIATPANLRCPWRGYLTDQRTFNNSPTASVRMRSLAEIQLVAPKLIRTVHETSGTTEIDKKSGAITCFKRANMSKCRFYRFSSLPRMFPAGDFLIKLSVEGAASDPCVNLAADIDYQGDFEILCSISRGIVEVTFSGLVDSFPAFEMYASLNGITKTLFTLPPPPGNTVTDLLGGASTPVGGRATFNCSLVSANPGQSRVPSEVVPV